MRKRNWDRVEREGRKLHEPTSNPWRDADHDELVSILIGDDPPKNRCGVTP